ncbi:hypothetical protein HYV80_03175 [Candidatus Woesearchaeota archaeon]|nr:hypothetical protein [Candidatus Woesearchaeota archaeon]
MMMFHRNAKGHREEKIFYGYTIPAQNWTKITKEAVNNSRPIVTVLQFFQFTGKGRWPTQKELRDMGYMAIAEGANGLFYWSIGANALAHVCSGWCDEKIEHFEKLKLITSELKSLEPALTSLDRPDMLIANSPASISTRVKYRGGKGYLIAYNHDNNAATATFTWAKNPTDILVYNEARSLAASENKFTDIFAPFEAHVYVISEDAGTEDVPQKQTPPEPSSNDVVADNEKEDNKKEERFLRIAKLSFIPPKCDRIADVDYAIESAGHKGETAVFEIKGEGLGINFNKEFLIGGKKDTYSGRSRLKVNDAMGVYPITARLFSSEGILQDTKTVRINFDECDKPGKSPNPDIRTIQAKPANTKGNFQFIIASAIAALAFLICAIALALAQMRKKK